MKNFVISGLDIIRKNCLTINLKKKKGIATDSLIGGITELPEARNSQLSELVKQASQF